MSNQGWIGFDLDGTLAHYDGWKSINHVGQPILPIVNLLKKYLEQGQPVKIFTARVYRDLILLQAQADGDGPGEWAKEFEELLKVREAIWLWLEKLGIPRLEITCVKDFSMVKLYDDRCIQVETNTGRIIE